MALHRSDPRKLILAVIVPFVLVPAGALASFSVAVTTSGSITSGQLVPPTSVVAANGTCTVLASTHVRVSWTATTSVFADGYQVFRSTTSGGPYTSVGTVNGRTTTSFTDTTAAFSTRYYYVVRSKRNSWRSANSNQATVLTPTTLCVV